MNISRRSLLAGLAGLAGIQASTAPARAFTTTGLRGSVALGDRAVRPVAYDDPSATLQRAIDEAASAGEALFLPPGTYTVSNLTLPAGARLTGVPGSTRIVYGGGGHLFIGTGVSHVRLSGLVIDGGNLPLADYAPALVHLSTVAHVVIEDCEIVGSSAGGVTFDRVSGRISRTTIRDVAEAAIHANDSEGLEISANTISDCANNGILVWRWSEGPDGTIVTGNTIRRIRARAGGTGQNGNAINVFRAGNVLVSNNRIDDCDFSAVRVNAGANCQILGNNCTRLGETAIFAEFAFDGAVIASNIVDGAANGISITNFNDGGRLAVCSANMVRNLVISPRLPTDDTIYGTGIAAEADCTLTGNVIEGAPTAGIALGWGPYLRNVAATGNMIRKCRIGIAASAVEECGPALIANNLISQVEDGAVLGMRWHDIATGELAGGSAPDTPPHLSISANSVN